MCFRFLKLANRAYLWEYQQTLYMLKPIPQR